MTSVRSDYAGKKLAVAKLAVTHPVLQQFGYLFLGMLRFETDRFPDLTASICLMGKRTGTLIVKERISYAEYPT
jgi:hypothetical protein